MRTAEFQLNTISVGTVKLQLNTINLLTLEIQLNTINFGDSRSSIKYHQLGVGVGW